jgi:hypothetical protein
VDFVQVDQPMAVALGTSEEILDLLDKGLPALRISPAEQLLLPGQPQAMQGGADRLAAAGPAEPLAHPAAAGSSAVADRLRLPAELRRIVGPHGLSRRGLPRSPGKGGAGALVASGPRML